MRQLLLDNFYSLQAFASTRTIGLFEKDLKVYYNTFLVYFVGVTVGKILFISAIYFVLIASCSVDESEYCDINNPCPEGYTCDLLTGQCEKEALVTDDEFSDTPTLPVDNEKNDPDAAEKTDDEKPDVDIVIKECEPDSFVMCDPGDFYNILRCNSSGTGVDAIPCGEMLVCEDNKCIEQLCSPKKRACSDEDDSKVFECSYLGTSVTDKILEDCGVGGYCLAGKCIFYCDKAASEHSYLGCDYFTAVLDTRTQRSDPIFALVIANTELEKVATVNVTITEDGITEIDAGKCVYCNDDMSNCMTFTTSKNLYVGPGKLGIIQFQSDRMLKSTQKSWLSYHIKSNLPITVYQFSPIDNSVNNPFNPNGKSKDWSAIEMFNNGQSYSNDASLLMPSTSVISEYRTVTFKSVLGGTAAGTNEPWPSYITVIGASSEDVNLIITPTDDIVAGEGVTAIAKGTDYEFTVKKFQVFNFETDELSRDLTGSWIRCKDPAKNCGPVIAFSGNASTVIPNDKGYADHLEHQLFPVQTLGKDYLIVKTKVKGEEHDYARIVAVEDGTTITYSPNAPAALSPYTSAPPLTTLNAGEWTEFYFKGSYYIKSDKPVMVAQFLTGANMISSACAAPYDPENPDYHALNCPGDPAMMLIPSSEQFRKDYVFLTPGSYKSNYATIALKTGTAAKINEKSVADLTEIPGSIYSYSIVDLGSEFSRHTLVCDEPCGLFVYGWEADVSYAYPGGLNLEKLSNN